jgi:hypothetical protein
MSVKAGQAQRAWETTSELASSREPWRLVMWSTSAVPIQLSLLLEAKLHVRRGDPSTDLPMIPPPHPVPDRQPAQMGQWEPTSVSAGQRLGGAPRRNRTADIILTMYPRPTVMLFSVFAGRRHP